MRRTKVIPGTQASPAVTMHEYDVDMVLGASVRLEDGKVTLALAANGEIHEFAMPADWARGLGQLVAEVAARAEVEQRRWGWVER